MRPESFSLVSFFLSALRLSTPLLFAAYGGIFSERSGVVNIALEGFILTGAFVAGAVAYLTGNGWIGLAAALAAGAAMGLLFAVLTVGIRGNHIIMGTALNILVMGMIPIVGKVWLGISNSTPSLGLDQRLSVWMFFAVAICLAPLVWILFFKTKFGLRLRASGENMEAAQSLGVSVRLSRFMAVTMSGLIAAAGGAFLSIAHGSQYSRNMSAGRGYIALAALILARWQPIPILATCFIFGAADSAQIILQSYVLPGGATLPVQWIQVFPYIVTILVLVGFLGRSEAPLDIGKNV